jgi:hypothetical protein
MEKQMVMVVPHWDDEHLSFISQLLSFSGVIHAIYTSEGDFLTKDAYNAGKKEFENYIQKISDYRNEKGFGQYIVDYYPDYGDINRQGISWETDAKIFRILENLLKDGEWDYLYTNDSIHPSHCRNRRIAEGLMRAPYIFNMRKILMGISQQEQLFSVSDDTHNACVYEIIGDADMEFIKNVLYPCYANKLRNFPLEQMINNFKCLGDKIGVRYAQNFIPKRIING